MTQEDKCQDVGIKLDTGKQRYDLLPPEGVAGIVEVLTYGANKYNARNWERGIDYGRCFAAVMRHLWAWWRGENLDPESGISHLSHAATTIIFLITYEARGMTAFDNRPTKQFIVKKKEKEDKEYLNKTSV